jgi:hypothetical protein
MGSPCLPRITVRSPYVAILLAPLRDWPRLTPATVKLYLSKYRDAIRQIDPNHLVLRPRKMRSSQRFSYLALLPALVFDGQLKPAKSQAPVSSLTRSRSWPKQRKLSKPSTDSGISKPSRAPTKGLAKRLALPQNDGILSRYS